MFVRLTHRPAGIHLRSATCPTYHFGDQILKPWWRHLMVGLVYRRVGIEPGICHDAVDKIVDHARNAINPTESFIQAGFLRLLWHNVNGQFEGESKSVPLSSRKLFSDI